MSVILATWEAEIKTQGQPKQIVHETPISKLTRGAKWDGGVA
jgi:hypothetical protein